jgi:4-diphosphocytidyl-2-C-methyl-D-erythritol kinase
MPQLRVEAPAKLNLHLQLGERRPDGFHDIESLFLALAFGDTLCIEPASPPLEILMDWQTEAPPAFPPEKNIISKAVSLFRDRTGFNEGLKVSVTKRIPLGGGLGGGSSDAAATLLGMNRLLAASQPGRKALNLTELVEIGADLGSDVPFFLYNTPVAWVRGRGEIVQPLDLPEIARKCSFVLANPGFPSDTASAYRLLDRMREGCPREKNFYHGVHGEHGGRERGRNRIEIPCPPSCPQDSSPPWLNSLYKQPRDWQFFNDFLPVFCDGATGDTALSEAGSVYQRIIDCMREQGADFAGLSGSGSTCFGVFSQHTQAESARVALQKHSSFVIITFSLARCAIP